MDPNHYTTLQLYRGYRAGANRDRGQPLGLPVRTGAHGVLRDHDNKGEQTMRNETVCTFEDDQIQEQVYKLNELLARAGWKLTNLTIEPDPDLDHQFDTRILTTEE